MLRVRVAQSLGQMAALERDWDRIATTADGASPFQRYDWARVWCELFGDHYALAVVWLTDGTDVVAILPLAVDPAGTARFIGTGPCDLLDWLALDATGSCALRCASALAATGIDHLDLTDIPPKSTLVAALRAGGRNFARLEVSTHELCPSVRLASRWDEYMATRSRRLRATVRRSERKLQALTGARMQVCSSAGEVRDGLQALIDLHLSWFRHRGRQSALLATGAREFLALAIPRFFRTGGVRLTLLTQGDDPVSAMITLKGEHRRYYYLSGVNPDHHALGAGVHHLASEIRAAIADKCDSFDLLRGAEPYKAEWANTGFRTLRCRVDLAA